MGLQGMINDMLQQCDFPTGQNLNGEVSHVKEKDARSIGRLISAAENFPEEFERVKSQLVAERDFLRPLVVERDASYRREAYEAGCAPPVVLLSHALWRARFGADPAIVGRRIVPEDVLKKLASGGRSRGKKVVAVGRPASNGRDTGRSQDVDVDIRRSEPRCSDPSSDL